MAKKPVTKTKRVKSSGSKEEGEYSSSGDSDDCGTAKASSKEREKEAPPLPPSSDMVVDKETDATVEDTVEEDKSLMEEVPVLPGTSTQAERVFSWMGWLLNKRRLSMSGETVSMQLFLKDNLVL